MFEFISHIYYRPGFKIVKPDGLSRHSEEEKCGMDTHFFNEEQLLDLKNDNIEEKEYVEDIKLEEIDVGKWEKKNGLWIVPQEYRLEVLHQYHYSQVEGH